MLYLAQKLFLEQNSDSVNRVSPLFAYAVGIPDVTLYFHMLVPISSTASLFFQSTQTISFPRVKGFNLHKN